MMALQTIAVPILLDFDGIHFGVFLFVGQNLVILYLFDFLIFLQLMHGIVDDYLSLLFHKSKDPICRKQSHGKMVFRVTILGLDSNIDAL